jgi:hypothetical protein
MAVLEELDAASAVFPAWVKRGGAGIADPSYSNG